MRQNNKNHYKLFASILCLSLVISTVFGGTAYATSGKVVKKDNLFPVLMYHHFVTSGEASGVVMTAEKFKKDMEYLEENGYVPLLPNDLIKIKNNKMDMPRKPVMITFDDGYESNYKIAYPILKETNMKATIFVIVNHMNRYVSWQVPKLTWDQMKEMYQSGIVDIQSHTFNLHNGENDGKYFNLAANGIQRKLIESRAQYEYRFAADVDQSISTIEERVGNKVTCIAYPYGAYEPWCTKVLEEKGIQFGFAVDNKMADLKGDQYCLYRYNIDMKTSLSQLLEGKNETEIF